MAEFAGDFQSFKSSLPFLEVDSSMELINQFAELNPSLLENPNLSIQSFLGFSGDNFLTQKQSEKSMNFGDDRQGLFHLAGPNVLPVIQPMASAGNVQLESKKIKVMEIAESSSGGNSSAGGDNKIKRKNNLGGGKRERSKEKRVEKPKEVIHVRARRGQATDNHSLAERVRREKINEKLKHLQDLVPGCYKTMGMAVMLDEIINYVKSLQNQVEFLSMKLSAASSFHDFNLEMEAMKIMQGANAYEAKDVERLMSEGYGGLTCLPTTWLI